MKWNIWYDVDRPKFEWFINGSSVGRRDAGPGSFTHTGENPYIRIGHGWNGFISHTIIMSPGGDMSSYWISDGVGLPLGMANYETGTLISVGSCPEITRNSGCT